MGLSGRWAEARADATLVSPETNVQKAVAGRDAWLTGATSGQRVTHEVEQQLLKLHNFRSDAAARQPPSVRVEF